METHIEINLRELTNRRLYAPRNLITLLEFEEECFVFVLGHDMGKAAESYDELKRRLEDAGNKKEVGDLRGGISV